MKIRKPEDEKYFKDIVLNNILDEISSETGAPTSKETKRKIAFKRNIIFGGLTLLTIFLLLLLFSFAIDKHKKKLPIKPIQTEVWKRKKVIKVANQVKFKTTIEPIFVSNRDKEEHDLAKKALKEELLK